MEKTVNRVELCGHAGIDPQVNTLKNGAKVLKFRMATNESYKNKNGEWVKDTTWHSISMWDKVAADAESKIKKGTLVTVTGKLVNRQYLDKNGIKQYITEIRAISFITPDSAEKSPFDE
jgi:single-strand DNA-binding protein